MRQRRKQSQAGKTATSTTSRNVQTTLRLPAPLYQRARNFVKQGSSRSVNDFIVNALAAYVRAKERKAIDDAFLPMKDDLEYRREALAIAEEFAASDVETIRIAKRDLVDA
jgi:hypothetical protein